MGNFQITSGKAQEKAVEMAPSKVGEVLKSYLNPLLLAQVEVLSKELNKVGSASQAEREDILLRSLASNQIALAFERTYPLIFGSQLVALQQLNANVLMLGIDKIQPIYEQAKSKYPELYTTNYGFREWLAFLQGTTLIANENGEVTITVRGKEFLKYIIDQGYSFKKYG